MKKNWNLLILAALVLYVLSPVDAVPGPVDDLMLTALYIAANSAGLLGFRTEAGFQGTEGE